jgi:hypothetical protein
MAAKKPPVAKGKAVPPKGKPVPPKGKGGVSDAQASARDKFKEMIAKKERGRSQEKSSPTLQFSQRKTLSNESISRLIQVGIFYLQSEVTDHFLGIIKKEKKKKCQPLGTSMI